MTLLPLSRDSRPLTAPERLLLVAAVGLVWLLAWATPLYPPDEGRFGSVSAAMAEGSSLVVPEFRGQPLVTKPPMTYWLQAVGVAAFGRTSFAVRLPSLVATSATLLLLFAFARRALGTRPALIATCLASVMPVTLVVGRLATSDALLGLTWITMLVSAWRAAGDPHGEVMPRSRYAFLFWFACGVGLLTKGPAALGPPTIVALWLMLAGRTRDLRHLYPLLGLTLALVPLLAWGWFVEGEVPDAGDVWWREIVGRVTGEAELRVQPIWFYVPALLIGMLPATAFLVLPGLNVPLRDAWNACTRGDARALCLLAVTVTLLVLSVSAGKMLTYVLPLAAPLAFLAAITLERCARGEWDARPAGVHPPDVRYTLAAVSALVFGAELAFALWFVRDVPSLLPLAIPLALAPIGCVVLVSLWKRDLRARRQGMAIAWVALAAAWCVRFGIEARFVPAMGAPAMLEEMRSLFGVDRPVVATVGFLDPTIAFYNNGQRTLEDVEPSLLVTARALRYPVIVLVDERRFDDLVETVPDLTRGLDPVATWTRWPGRRTRVMVLADPIERSSRPGGTTPR